MPIRKIIVRPFLCGLGGKRRKCRERIEGFWRRFQKIRHNSKCARVYWNTMAQYEYEGTYRYKRYRRPWGSKKYIVIAAVLAAVICVIVFFQRNVSGVLVSLSESEVRAIAAEAVNDAVAKTLEWNGVDYGELVTITRDGENNVLSIEANAQNVNLLARQTVTLSMANLNGACEEGIKVPVGAFTGIEVLAGFGPKVTFKIIPVGMVTCEFDSSFQSAGINQTVHSIYMDVTATVNVVMPSGNREVSAVTQVLICESVIVGKVPETYLNGNIFGNG